MSALRISLMMALSVCICIPMTLLAKGLDTLQAPASGTAPAADVPGTGASEEKLATPTSPSPSPALPQVAPPAQPAIPAGTPTPGPVAVTTAPPPPPGLQKLYLATSLSWFNLSGNKGGWHSSMIGDLEVGYKVFQLLGKFDTFSTFRYRPASLDVVADSRAYRGVVEGFLFGGKVHFPLNSKLTAFGSLEAGLIQTHLNAIDSWREVDKSLEKSGVDLSAGGGVSYLVLDKLGVGSRLAVGAGTFKTLQLGVDLRFLF